MWPDYYPDNCPPEDAEEYKDKLFRLVSSKGPKKADFIPWALKNTEKFGENCQACGLSSFISRDACMRQREMIPRLRKKLLAAATLNESMGKVKNTPSNNNPEHYTWWVPASLNDPHQMFSVIENE